MTFYTDATLYTKPMVSSEPITKDISRSLLTISFSYYLLSCLNEIVRNRI